jgi:hypothetical protein
MLQIRWPEIDPGHWKPLPGHPSPFRDVSGSPPPPSSADLVDWLIWNDQPISGAGQWRILAACGESHSYGTLKAVFLEYILGRFRTSTNTMTNTSSILFQLIKWYSICKRKMPTYRSKSTKSCSVGTSRTCLNEMAPDDVMIWMHVPTKWWHVRLSLSFSYWCETSLLYGCRADPKPFEPSNSFLTPGGVCSWRKCNAYHVCGLFWS